MLRTIYFINFFITVMCIQNPTSFYSDYDLWNHVACDENFQPDRCDLNNTFDFLTVDDFDRCGPAHIPLSARNYYLGASGRRQTYKDNKNAFRKIRIVPKTFRNVAKSDTKAIILGREIDFPIGIAPVGILKLAHPDGELAVVSGVSDMNTIMILSSYSTVLLEDVAKKAKGSKVHLWMQVYIFKNRTITADLVRRAERSGYEAIVVTTDSSIDSTLTCDARRNLNPPPDIGTVNIGRQLSNAMDAHATFKVITWIKRMTKLPVIAKGIVSAQDAILAVRAGASAIIVSNHGGRQLDGSPAAIDALPEIVDAVNGRFLGIEIYMDGGVRNGYDVYKAIARGAKMVFVGRPTIWGIALNGSEGVTKMMNILKTEFNETMLLSGDTKPCEIKRDSLITQYPTYL